MYLRLASIGLVLILSLGAQLIEFRPDVLARSTWFLSGGTALAIIYLYRRVWSVDLLSPAFVYGLVFWLFHFGLIFPASIFPDILGNYDPWNISWTYEASTGKAALEALIFLITFLFFCSFRKPLAEGDLTESQEKRDLVVTGTIAIALGLLLFVFAILQYGVGVFFAEYERFFEIHNRFSWAVVLVAFGLILHLAGGRRVQKVFQTGSWTFFPLAALTFIAGARTSPLFSAAVLGIVVGKRGLKMSRPMFWMIVTTGLIAIALVQETRQVGLSEILLGQAETATLDSPVSGMTELGGSLRPLSATVDYVDSGESLLYGETYFYPIIRQVEDLFGVENSTPETDPRFIATHISLLYGAAMGYSTVAEAYANGGTIGVVVFAALWGLMVVWLQNHSNKPYGLALLGGVFLPMMINIRNSFIYVPAWVFLAVVTLLFSRYVLKPRFDKKSIQHTVPRAPHP